jgi:hypothetical protein
MESKDLTVTIESKDKATRSLLPDVIEQLESLVRFLRSLTDEDTTFEVVSLSKQSPMRAVLRPLRKTAVPKARGRRREYRYRQVATPTDRAARTIGALEKNRKLPAYADPYALTQLREFADDLSRTGHYATLTARAQTFKIDEVLKRQIDSSLGDARISYTSYTGLLERLNVHGARWSFTIYPPAGPSRILCYFHRDSLELVRGMVKEVVTVRGRGLYRGDSAWPVQIRVDSIERKTPASDGQWEKLPAALASHWLEASDDEKALMEAAGA